VKFRLLFGKGKKKPKFSNNEAASRKGSKDLQFFSTHFENSKGKSQFMGKEGKALESNAQTRHPAKRKGRETPCAQSSCCKGSPAACHTPKTLTNHAALALFSWVQRRSPSFPFALGRKRSHLIAPSKKSETLLNAILNENKGKGGDRMLFSKKKKEGNKNDACAQRLQHALPSAIAVRREK